MFRHTKTLEVRQHEALMRNARQQPAPVAPAAPPPLPQPAAAAPMPDWRSKELIGAETLAPIIDVTVEHAERLIAAHPGKVNVGLGTKRFRWRLPVPVVEELIAEGFDRASWEVLATLKQEGLDAAAERRRELREGDAA